MNQRMWSDLILSCKSKTNNPIKRKTKGHVLLFVVDLFCLMFYFGFVFVLRWSQWMWFEELKRSQRRRQRKQLWSHRRSKKGGKILRLGVINFIVRHIQQKTNFTQTTVNKRTKRLGFWCLSRCRRRSSFFRHCSSGRLLCTRIEYAPWLVRVEGKCKRPSDNWFIRSVWGVEQEPRSYFADVTNCDKITSATQATIRDFKIQRRDGNKNVA